MKFNEFNLSEAILKGIEAMGFEEASPIQAESMAPLLEGKDVIAQAQTGTGKTAAYGIPMLERVEKKGPLQGLVLCPTRELCLQVANELANLGAYKKGVKILPVYGGTSIERQIRALKGGVQIVVGTPGRVMDHMRRKTLRFDDLAVAILDEADEMFDMGFRDDMRTILDETPEDRQTCFFSATMEKDIMDFSAKFQRDPEIIRIKHKQLTVENIEQYYLEMKASMKPEILSRLVDIYDPTLAIVFCNTKKRVDALVSEMASRGYAVDGLHGDLKQNQRDSVMKRFRNSSIDMLVATDVAARGIDVGDVDMVVNYDLPQDEEYYVHRIGRTARAGRKGLSFSFIVGRDIYKLEDIVRYTKADLAYMELPTMEQMDVNKRENLEGKVAEILDAEADLSRYKPMVESMLRLEYGAVEISAALLKLLDDSTQSKKHDALDEVDYGKKFRARGLRKDRKTKEKKEKSGKKHFTNNAKLYMDKGRKDGITPKAILAIFKKETDLGADVVGNILIRDHHTVIEVPKKAAKSAIEQLDGMKSRGKTYHVRAYRD
ncbi:DEAD/DEAH box helicase [Peptoniphilus sp. HCN-40583]|uniref:DEAD/DEAH box helicase n=1 Tax=Peptoniphilus sp. HCN-40583 TaxID=3134662 RepID=UPI0030BA6924